MRSGLTRVCDFLCFPFPMPQAQRAGWAGKGVPMSSIPSLSGPRGNSYNAQDKVGAPEIVQEGAERMQVTCG